MGCKNSKKSNSFDESIGEDNTSFKELNSLDRLQTSKHIFQRATTKIYQRNDKPMMKSTTSGEDILKLYTISKNEFGRGKFGVVRRAKLLTNPHKNYAIKSIAKESIKDDVMYLKREIEIFQTLDHPNIVKFYEVYQDKDHIHFVVEFCDGGNLMGKLSKQICFSEVESKRFVYQILVAVCYLHNMGVCHRDIKPDNTLLDSAGPDPTIKLTDFGLSKLDPGNKGLKSLVGTPSYVAPEIIKKNYNMLCDIWSVGVMLYLFLSGKHPFTGSSSNQVFDAILNQDLSFRDRIWSAVSDNAKDLISKMLTKDPDYRITAAEALKDPWFAQPILELSNAAKSLLTKEFANRFVDYKMKNFFEFEILKMMVFMFDESREDIKRLKKIFRSLDKDNNGFLELSQLRNFIDQSLNVKVNDREIQKVMDNLNCKTSDRLCFSEFLAIGCDKSLLKREKYVKNIFSKFDTNKDAEIDAEDLVTCYRRFGITLHESYAREILAFDTEEKITFKEFREITMQLSN